VVIEKFKQAQSLIKMAQKHQSSCVADGGSLFPINDNECGVAPDGISEQSIGPNSPSDQVAGAGCRF
jgi:hypothetical protein